MRFLLALLLTAGAATEEALVVGSDGVRHVATEPETLTRPVQFAATARPGLEATFLALAVGGAVEDDWRATRKTAGTRRDRRINQPRTSFGSRDERRRFGIAGNDQDWDAFAVQWDGWIRIPAGGADLATSSDDGSRVWIDLDRDGRCQAGEWGGNGWGEGQGETLRAVHQALPGGNWPIRVQYNEFGGGNSCTLQWRWPGNEAWSTVPEEAFASTPVLELHGPISVRTVFSGNGELHCGDGVRLASLPVGPVAVIGQAALAADVDSGRFPLSIAAGASLDLAGHALRIARIDGKGTVRLSGGTLALGDGSGVRVAGRGRLEVSGDLSLADLAPEVEVALLTAGAAVRSPGRCVVAAPLAAPLATVLELHPVPAGATTLAVTLDGPLAGAGLVAWRADRHGRWFQRFVASGLADGRQSVVVDLSADAPLAPMRHDGAWNAATAAESPRAGLLVYSDRALSGRVVADARWLPAASAAATPRLEVLAIPPERVRTGRRVELAVLPHPFPEAPLDPEVFALELAVTAPDGITTRFAGFADQPFRRLDRGDREVLSEGGPPRFAVRWRARQAGPHRLRVAATWADGGRAELDLPDVVAEGPDWDGIARVDAADPRFLSRQGELVWPIGHNLNSTYDVRSRQRMGTQLTVNRGSFVREGLLARLASAGGTGTEVWLSPWNLGLEWTDAWPGFHGTGRPNLGNAWALDRLLDQAEDLGMSIVLSIFNHGMGRDGDGAEQDWRHHPWNRANGGWLERPAGLFTDPEALRRQGHYFRYLAARWGDSPAVLAWKLWAEVDLTNASKPEKAAWHERAAGLMAGGDPWRHPVTTHWCGNWRHADPAIADLPGIHLLTIDAYHGPDVLIADLLAQSTLDPRRPSDGLARYGKPVLVTEYGGNWDASPGQRMQAQLAVGGWAALTHGHAGMPMLWWFEWIDQGGHYAPFGAIRRFLAGEDLRGAQARTILLSAQDGSTALWCRAWQRPGRLLGYLLDPEWGREGGEGRPLATCVVDCGEIMAGAMRIAWWDADTGLELTVTAIDHPGGALRLTAPSFRRHLAFKLWRLGDQRSTM